MKKSEQNISTEMSLNIKKAASTRNGGIKRLTEDEIHTAISAADSFTGTLCKFVPASGAATRMFAPLFGKDDEALALVKKNSEKIAINLSTPKDKLVATPKGLLPFHRYGESVRTPFEEHLVEGAFYAKDLNDVVNLHFTVSEEHIEEFRKLLRSKRGAYSKRFGCTYHVSFSTQDPKTDVVAYGADNKPAVKKDGTVLKRPAGHGALLKNLQSINEDFIFIKNIDNVVKEEYLDDTIKWKRVLLGRAVMLKAQANLLQMNLQSAQGGDELEEAIAAATSFLEEELLITQKFSAPMGEIADYLIGVLDRPLRVCGMVKNQGEAGGGPFICNEEDGSTSLQILEGVQVEDKELLKKSTHFNPVDIVCCIKDCSGAKYRLSEFTDPSTALKVEKTFEGKKVHYTELPGLWNGSMSRWNTQFIEVPLSTFNPVKSIQDLLRKNHQ